MPPAPGPVAAAILTGGLARRMAGASKAALRIGGRRIIDRQLEVLRLVADPIFIVGRAGDELADLDLTIVPDVVPAAGSLGGIYTAIMSSPRDRTLVVAGDMPYLSLPLLQRLTAPSDADLVIPRSSRGIEPLCATWSAACAAAVRRRIDRGLLKAGLVVEELRVEEIGPEVLASYDPHGLLFVNVNTPHDYERAQDLSRLESNRPQDIMNVSDAGPKPA